MPRRPSTSSTDEDGLEVVQWKQESSVVKSVPKGVHVNDYPIFELRDAEVFSSDGTRIASALEAEIYGPLIVRGYLVIEDAKQKTHLLMRVRKPVPIEIRCVSHSIGETEDKSPLVWLGGRGGWYEINPAESYRPMYSKMCQAISMYYAIVDILSAPGYKIKKGAVEIDELLFQATVKTGDANTLEDARLLCEEHAPFFIYKFMEGAEDLAWGKTPFCIQMMKNNERIVSLVKERMDNPLTVGRASATIAEVTAGSSARSTRSPSLQAPQQEIPIRQRKTGRGSSKLQSETITISSSSNDDDDDVQPSIPARRQTRTRANVVKSDSSDDDIPPERETKMRKLTHPSENEGDQAAFESVLQAVKDTYIKVGSGRGPTYSKLVNTMYNDYTFLRYIPGPQTRQVEEVLCSNAQGLIDKLGSREYAAIYPKLKAFVSEPLEYKTLKETPFVARPRKRYAPSFARTKSRSSSVQSEVRTPQRAGKGLKTPGRSRSALRPIKTITKASRAIEVDNATNPSNSDDSDDDMLNAAADMSDLQASPCPPGQRAPALFVDAEVMPSTEAKGLDNTWMCSIEGCHHVVRGGTKYNRKMRIQDHLQGHTEGSENDALVDLAVTEAAGNVSINNLLEKIRNMGGSTDPGRAQPIKRKLLV